MTRTNKSRTRSGRRSDPIVMFVLGLAVVDVLAFLVLALILLLSGPATQNRLAGAWTLLGFAGLAALAGVHLTVGISKLLTAVRLWVTGVFAAIGLAFVGTATTGAAPAQARWDWMSATVVCCGLLGLPALARAITARQESGRQRELRTITGVAAWLPFAGLLLLYPTPLAPNGPFGLSPAAGVFLFFGLNIGVHLVVAQLWRARSTDDDSALPAPGRPHRLAADEAPVGVELGALPGIYGDWFAHDLPAALYSIPVGVEVRVGYRSRGRAGSAVMVIEGSTNGTGVDRVRIGKRWLDLTQVELCGVEILRDDRRPGDCLRTPPLLSEDSRQVSSPPSAGEVPDSASVSAADSSPDSSPDSSAVSSPDSPAVSSADSSRAAAGQDVRSVRKLSSVLAGQDRRTREAMIRDVHSDLDRAPTENLSDRD
jgi:hypothetical protein